MKNLFKILILSLIFFSCSFQIQDNPFSLQIQDGPFIVYYKNGQIEGEGAYENGKLDGISPKSPISDKFKYVVNVIV